LAHYDNGVPHTIAVPDVPLQRFLQSSARRFPRRTAILYEGGRMSYRRLDQASSRLAERLGVMGYGPGHRVMILLPNLPQTLLAFFGVLKVGATVVLASPVSEASEVMRQVRDSRVDGLITLTKLADVGREALHIRCAMSFSLRQRLCLPSRRPSFAGCVRREGTARLARWIEGCIAHGLLRGGARSQLSAANREFPAVIAPPVDDRRLAA
jgi:long-chain acyl-CoA synthetase